MEKKKIDCALFFALEEEFNILKDYTKINPKDGYFIYTFNDKHGIIRECITGYVSKPGSLEAYKYLTTFYQSFEPQFVFIIGISGQISDDLKLGDVIVASSIDKYDYNSKQKNGESHFSGDTINLPGMSNTFSQLPNLYEQDYTEWQSKTKSDLSEHFKIDVLNELINKKLIRDNRMANYFYGKIATGEAVVDDIAFKERIKMKDRKLLCVDMESYGFANAGENFSNIVVIRAISDTADGKKKETDNFENNVNKVRKWALENAYRFFNMLILQKIEFSTNSLEQIERKQISHNIQSVDEKLILEPELYFSKYADLFKHLLLNKIDALTEYNLFEYLGYELERLNKKDIIVVQGKAGSGKSSFLYIFYKYFNRGSQEITYLDLHKYKSNKTKESVEIFKKDIRHCINSPNTNFLIIDGVDQYERFFNNLDVSISPFWDDLQLKYKNIIIGLTLQDYNNEEDETIPFYLPEPKLVIELESFRFDQNNIEILTNNLLLINGKKSSQDIKLVTNFLNKTGLKEMDWLNTNLIINKIGSANYVKVESMGKFYFNYAKEFFSNSHPPDSIKIASDLAFRKFIKVEKLTNEEYNSRYWQFIQISNTIKQFLIAEHLINTYSSLNEDFDKAYEDLKHIYSYKINTYFKDNLNRNSVIQDKIFTSITNNYEKLSLYHKPNICYILGRLKDPQLLVNARSFLHKQLINEIADYKIERYKNEETSFRQHLLLIRTIYISLVYQGDLTASREYLQYLLNNQEWDDLNRGFHLEYYDDKPYDPHKLGLHNDDILRSFPKTFKRLSDRIFEVIRDPQNSYYQMIDIELHTITSLALNRHIQGKLDERIRLSILDILEAFQRNQIQLIKNPDIQTFILFAFKNLSNKHISIFENIKTILKIKTVSRSGWNYSGLNKGIKIERKVKNPESVADHTYGAILLAVFFLPETIDFQTNYSKTDVIKTLIIHDLAESQTGDIVSFNKTDPDKKVEIKILRMILSMDSFKGIANLSEYKTLWANYISKSTLTAKIASDIDKIDQLVQLITYGGVENNSISDYNSWKNDLINDIETEIGKNIIATLFEKELLDDAKT